MVRVYQGDTAGALRDASEALRSSRGDSLMAIATLAWIEAVVHDTAQARRHARTVTTARGAVLDEAQAWTAAALLALGDREAALAVLERCQRNAFFRFYLGYEAFDSLRAGPRAGRRRGRLRYRL